MRIKKYKLRNRQKKILVTSCKRTQIAYNKNKNRTFGQNMNLFKPYIMLVDVPAKKVKPDFSPGSKITYFQLIFIQNNKTELYFSDKMCLQWKKTP